MDDVHVFVADSSGVIRDAGAIDTELMMALELLTGDGMPGQKAADLVVAAREGGQDPEAFARHLLKLRAEWRKLNPERSTRDG